MCCHNCGQQATAEVIIVSRSEGTAPCYRLQIVDFEANGIHTWSYPSDGKPEVNGRQIGLGRMDGGYQGAATTVTYTKHVVARRD